ncbi:hypothetical protein RRF57_005904 [Xylaria bambusicola]|uniref:Uncharacterized protein n=1 Tax=Xylaria bambusicola TaxID=326684 RepID=A0AAN7UMW2_9PEZI
MILLCWQRTLKHHHKWAASRVLGDDEKGDMPRSQYQETQASRGLGRRIPSLPLSSKRRMWPHSGGG